MTSPSKMIRHPDNCYIKLMISLPGSEDVQISINKVLLAREFIGDGSNIDYINQCLDDLTHKVIEKLRDIEVKHASEKEELW